MPGRVFGERLDRDIDPMPERLEEVDAPRVVHQHLGTARVRGAGQGGDVLYLERVAAGALRVDHRRVGPHQLR
jgi:hypothetical protein